MRRTAALLAASLALAACSGGDKSSTTTLADGDAAPATTAADDTSPSTTAPTAAPGTTSPPPTEPTEPAFEAIELDAEVASGVEQITVVGLAAGTDVRAVGVDADADAIDLREAPGGTVDEFGGLVIRHLDSDDDWRLIVDATGITEPYDVLGRDEHPDPAFFAEQRLPTEGLGYITARDGTTLSASVWLPGPADAGPYPTLVEYSGYTPSNPESSTFAPLWNALGYAYVGVNIRGTGCSGGSFRYFEYTQSTDGYDAVEAVAAQPWVQNNRVGMVGVSYPGISQLFVAQTQPPSLAAITPFSVLADSAISTLYPGGILNTGFAVPWTQERMDEARPEGQQWAADRIAAGDEECAANQLLRLQNPDLLEEITDNAFWTDDVAGEISPLTFIDRITVPTFVAGAWQDEQTGGHFATMLDGFTGTDHLYASVLNGLHTESIGPAVLPRLIEFLDLYVAERVPSLGVARGLAPIVSSSLYGTSEVALPAEDRFAGMTFDEALAAFESEPPIRVLFEEGAADGFPARAPMARFEAGFDAWPIPEAVATTWVLTGDDDGTPLLADTHVGDVVSSSYVATPDGDSTFYEGSSSGIWSVDVTYDWANPDDPNTYVSFATEPLADETVVVGSASVDLWIRVDAPDTDVEVTLTEIRPDGQEMYVQSGWLRASQRRLDEDASTSTRPVQTHREEDAAPLPEGEFELARVEVFPFAHVFRAGSRIRLTVDAPGGNRPVWQFETIVNGETVEIGHGPEWPSALILPVIATVDAPDALPECGALRGQPCRAYTGP